MMSRYTIAAPPPYAYAVVGYDPPLGTFFTQVFRRRRLGACARVVRWIGTDVQELPTIEALTAALADVLTIPTTIQAHLQQDQQALGFRPNSGTWLMLQ